MASSDNRACYNYKSSHKVFLKHSSSIPQALLCVLVCVLKYKKLTARGATVWNFISACKLDLCVSFGFCMDYGLTIIAQCISLNWSNLGRIHQYHIGRRTHGPWGTKAMQWRSSAYRKLECYQTPCGRTTWRAVSKSASVQGLQKRWGVWLKTRGGLRSAIDVQWLRWQWLR